MHLSQAWVAVPGLARRDLSPVYEVVPSLAGGAGDSLIRDMWDLADTTMLGVKSDPERDPAVLADRIESRAKEHYAGPVAQARRFVSWTKPSTSLCGPAHSGESSGWTRRCGASASGAGGRAARGGRQWVGKA